MHTPLGHDWVSRRVAFRVAGAVTTAAFLAACSTPEVDPAPVVDSLIEVSAAARADADAARAGAVVLPGSAAVLTTIGSERTAHADALDREIARARVGVPSSSTPQSSLEPSPTPAPTLAPPTLAQIKDLLAKSAQDAAALGKTESGYRAGLLGSISAACAVEVGILLS